MTLSSEKFQKLLVLKRPDAAVCGVCSGIVGLTRRRNNILKRVLCLRNAHTGNLPDILKI